MTPMGQTMGSSLYLGGIFKLDSESAFCSTLKFAEGKTPSCKFGFRRYMKNYRVSNSYNTNGTIKTMFTYMQNELFRLKFFLKGNLFKDDFQSGYSVNLGPQ